MSRRPTRRGPAVGLLLTAAAAVLALTGCSAGAVTQTDTTVSSTTGAEGQAGSIAIRDLSIDPGPVPVVPAGATVFLRGTLANQADTTDRLVSVSTPYAAGVRAEGVTVLPGQNAVMIVGSAPVPVGPPIAIARLSGTARITLGPVTQVLNAGPTYDVTLTFERSGSITLPVPVVSTTELPVS